MSIEQAIERNNLINVVCENYLVNFVHNRFLQCFNLIVKSPLLHLRGLREKY